MKCGVKTKFLLWKTDFICFLARNKKEILLYTCILLFGIGFGVFLGIKIGEQDSPFCTIAKLFRAEYSPFSSIFPELLRFSVYCLIAVASFFLPFYPIYAILSLFFFGKHFGEFLCLSFLTDPVFCAILSLLLICIPLILLGAALLLHITLSAREFRLCNGGFWCKNNLKRAGFFLFRSILIYFALLIIIYLLLCGTLCLLVLAL